MGFLIPVIIVLSVLLVAAVAALIFFMSKKKAQADDAGNTGIAESPDTDEDEGEDGDEDDVEGVDKNDTIIKGLIAAVVILPLLIIMLIVFNISGNKDDSSQGNDPAPVADNNNENNPVNYEVFEPLILPQMTYRELRRHNLMLMEWIRSCDKNDVGAFIIQTKYPNGDETIRELLLYRNDGAFEVEKLPDDETFPDPEGVYFNCVKKEDDDQGYTIAFYSWVEDNNTGDCYVTEKGKVLTLAESGWGGKPEVLFPTSIDYERDYEKAYELYNLKTDYVGEEKAVGEFLDTLKISEIGVYEFKVKTDKEPFRISVDYSAVMFALIKNLGEVEWTIDGEPAVLYTREEMDQEYGGDISAYSESKEKFVELWESTDL